MSFKMAILVSGRHFGGNLEFLTSAFRSRSFKGVLVVPFALCYLPFVLFRVKTSSLVRVQGDFTVKSKPLVWRLKRFLSSSYVRIFRDTISSFSYRFRQFLMVYLAEI